MAVAFSHSSGAGNASGGTTSFSWTHNATGDNYLTVGLAFRPNVSNISVTFNGVAMTLLGSRTTGGDGLEFCYVYGLANPSSGSYTVSVSWTTTSRAAGVALSFTGTNITAGNVATNASSGTNDLTITNSPGPGASDLLVAYGAVDENASFLSVTNGTQRVIQGQADGNYISLASATDTDSTVTFHSSTTSIGWTGVSVVLTEVTAAKNPAFLLNFV